MWQNNAGGRGRSGCRPCCGATPSAPRPRCSPSTLLLIPSAEKTHAVFMKACLCLYCTCSNARLHTLKIISVCPSMFHCAWLNVESFGNMYTCTIISSVSRIIMLASVARLPSISASCSSSALVLQSRNQKNTVRKLLLLPNCYVNYVALKVAQASSHHIIQATETVIYINNINISRKTLHSE